MRIFLGLLLLVASSLCIAQPDGRLLASQCFQCHGPNGNSTGEIDSIAGESANEIYEEMQEFKFEPKNDIMNLQARIYTDQEVRAIADYIGSLPGNRKGD
jgi:cytochrome subunit of sulfide dehydrogenase